MTFIRNDFDESISKDSVFDWGHASWASLKSTGNYNRNKSSTDASSAKGHPNQRSSSSSASRNDPVISRYDPSTISRISNDIGYLIEDSGSVSSDSDAESGCHDIENGNNENSKKSEKKKKKIQQPNHYGPGGVGVGVGSPPNSQLFYRQVITVCSLVVIIILASLAIGDSIVRVKKHPYYSGVETINSDDNSQQQQQQLLEIAERVITACSERELGKDTGAECRQLCHSRMCCFESSSQSEDGESNSCEEDESKECAVYAGCEALIEGVPVDGGAEVEDEE
eukprot:848110_1